MKTINCTHTLYAHTHTYKLKTFMNEMIEKEKLEKLGTQFNEKKNEEKWLRNFRSLLFCLTLCSANSSEACHRGEVYEYISV